MSISAVKKYVHATDLHAEKNQKWVIVGLLALLFILAVVIRKSLIHFQNPDYMIFSSWYDFVKAHGIHSFKAGFSNYNPPYTYFLYIATLLPISKIVAIKGLLFVFDVVLAVSVYLLVSVFRSRKVACTAALASLFLPTVMITGVFWGQFDQLYVACMLFSVWAALRGKSQWAWAFFGVAVAVKLQAIFLLPALSIFIFKKIRWYDAIWGIVSFLLLTLPPMFTGRSLHSLLDIYPAQARLFSGVLTLNAPNMYQWFPNSAFQFFNQMGIYLTVAVVVFVLLASLWYKKFSNRELLVVSSLMLYVMPFILPAMHERYFFPAGVLSLVLAFAYPTRTFIAIAVLMQIITLFSYGPFLFGTLLIPFTFLSLGVLVIICMLTTAYMGWGVKRSKIEE